MSLIETHPKLAGPFRRTRPLDFVSSIARCRLALTSKVLQSLYLYAAITGRTVLRDELQKLLKEVLEADGVVRSPATPEESSACTEVFRGVQSDPLLRDAVKSLNKHQPILYMSEVLDQLDGKRVADEIDFR